MLDYLKINRMYYGYFRGVADLKANTVFIKDYLAYFDIQSMIRDGTQTLTQKSFQRSGDKDIIEFRNVSLNILCQMYLHLKILILLLNPANG